MNPERFRKVEQAFQRARRVTGDDRRALLDELCAGDDELRHEVEALLHQHETEEGGVVDQPALGAGFKVGDAGSTGGGALPERIGRYRIVRLIGEGGMGVVYLAEQENPHRSVALKVMKSGVATPAIIRRFEQEAHVLGRLKHPGIAQVYEAGIHAEGGVRIPFIVMEHVAGPPLNEYVEQRRPDLRARLELFRRICDAVHHAHVNGIVHRDLKPGNILIEDGSGDDTTKTGAPRPRILDFGIARVTDADMQTVTMQTGTGQLIGTVRYMSPEQAAGDPHAVDARSDVYALGVIAYELLSGRMPYDLHDKMVHEAVRVIRDDDPTPLSTIDRGLRGDVNTILGKALEKDRARRYQSAAELEADIRRFLDDEPISAHPPSAIYQIGKFARRNRALVTGAAAVLLALVLGTAIASWQAVAATKARDAAQIASIAETEQRRLAEHRFNEVRALARTFIIDFDNAIMFLPGSLPARRLVAETALTYLDRLAAQSTDDPRFRVELASAYAKVGDIQGMPDVPNLGDAPGALASYRRALELLDSLESDIDVGHDRLIVVSRIGSVLMALGRREEAFERHREALTMAEARWAVDPDDPVARRDLTTSVERVGDLLANDGRLEEAMAAYERVLELTELEVARAPESRPARRGLALAELKIGRIHLASGRADRALTYYQTFMDLCAELASEDPNDVITQRDLSVAHTQTALALEALNRGEEAAPHHEETLRITERLVVLAPEDAQARFDLAADYNKAGERMFARGRMAEAADYIEKFVAIAEELAAAAPDTASYQRRAGVARFKMGQVLAARAEDDAIDEATALDRWREAAAWYRKSLETFTALHDAGLASPGDEGVPLMLMAEIARCEGELGAEE